MFRTALVDEVLDAAETPQVGFGVEPLIALQAGRPEQSSS